MHITPSVACFIQPTWRKPLISKQVAVQSSVNISTVRRQAVATRTTRVLCQRTALPLTLTFLHKPRPANTHTAASLVSKRHTPSLWATPMQCPLKPMRLINGSCENAKRHGLPTQGKRQVPNGDHIPKGPSDEKLKHRSKLDSPQALRTLQSTCKLARREKESQTKWFVPPLLAAAGSASRRA